MQQPAEVLEPSAKAFEASFARIPGFLYKTALRRIAASFEPYHPIALVRNSTLSGERNCADRWALIEKEIVASKAVTLLDLGCAEGFFVQKAASRCGCLALGVDSDVRRIALASGSVLLNKIKGAGFMLAEITPGSVRNLPIHDVVLFQSVLHHAMYSRGLEYAREIMIALRSRVGSVLIFDMGQSDEKESDWAKDLPDMGSDPHAWIADFLHSAGYSTVEKIGESDSYKSATRRALFRLVP